MLQETSSAFGASSEVDWDEFQAEFPLRDNSRIGGLGSAGLPLVCRLSRRSINPWNSLLTTVAKENDYHKFKSSLDDYLLVR